MRMRGREGWMDGLIWQVKWWLSDESTLITCIDVISIDHTSVITYYIYKSTYLTSHHRVVTVLSKGVGKHTASGSHVCLFHLAISLFSHIPKAIFVNSSQIIPLHDA
jgi:hypothetical protein